MTPRFYVHYFAYFFIGSGVASLSLFAPTIVAGLGYKDLDAQLYTVPPYAVAYGVTLFAAWLSDRLKDRGLVAGLSFVAASIAFIISGMTHSKTHLLSHEWCHHSRRPLLLSPFSVAKADPISHTKSRAPGRGLQSPVRPPLHSNKRGLWRPPLSLRMGRRQQPHNYGRRLGNSYERGFLGSGPDHRRVDLPQPRCAGVQARPWRERGSLDARCGF